jgi:hypothetical protein
LRASTTAPKLLPERRRRIESRRATRSTSGSRTTAAPEARPDFDHPVGLEQANRLAHGAAAGFVALDHLRLVRKPGPRLQVLLEDLVGDRVGDHLAHLGGTADPSR